VKISSGIVGATAGPRVHGIDARWLMAYAAALGDVDPEYMDTARDGGIAGHPLFAVCYEWPLALDLRAATMPDEVAVRGVHATHHLRIHRRVRPGDRLTTTATVIAVESRAPGAYVTTRFEAVGADGLTVSTTDYGSIYRGVAVDGGDFPDREVGRGASRPLGERVRDAATHVAPAVSTSPPDWSTRVPVAAGLAHVYTECARIWNPIHTNRAVALAARLPDIILHGTATLALAVSAVLRHEGLGVAAPVMDIRCRFSGMVPMPGEIAVDGWRRTADPRGVAFRVRTPDGRAALRDGWLALSETRRPVEHAR